MIEIQDIYNTDFYVPCYYKHLYGYNPSYYGIHGYGYHSGSGTDSHKPHRNNSLLRSRSISFESPDGSDPSKSHDNLYELPKYRFLSKRSTSCYDPQDYSYRSRSRRYKPRGYSYLSGSGTGYEACGYDYNSSSEPSGFDPIPIGRSGYAYRRRYSCRPITGSPSCYGCRVYYPPSYWMERNRYYGPC